MFFNTVQKKNQKNKFSTNIEQKKYTNIFLDNTRHIFLIYKKLVKLH